MSSKSNMIRRKNFPVRRGNGNRRMIGTEIAQAKRLKPPMFEANPSILRKYRFVSTSASVANITYRTLLQAAGVQADSAILGTSVWSSVRLNRIKVWAPTTAVGANTTASVLFNTAGNAGNAKEFTDSSMNISVPIFISCAPPANTLASFWGSDATTIIAQIIVPVGGIVDVSMDLIMGDNGQTPAPNGLVTVGNTIGLMYYYPLDGRGGTFNPVGLTLGG